MAKARRDTRKRLTIAALQLFAEEGIDAVSMRTINTNAGARNASAVHYHFGNKQGIIEAVIEFIKEQVDSPRIDSVEALERQAGNGEQPGVRQIMWAAFMPYYQLRRDKEYGEAALRFLARLQNDMSPEIQDALNRDPHQIAARVDKLLAAALPGLDDRVRHARYLLAWSIMVQGLASTANLERTVFGNIRQPTEESLHRFFDYVIGGIEAPVSNDWPPTGLE